MKRPEGGILALTFFVLFLGSVCGFGNLLHNIVGVCDGNAQ